MSRSARRRGGRWIRKVAGAIFLLATQAFGGSDGGAPGSPSPRDQDPADERQRMVEHQLEARGIRDERVLAAMRKVRRHRFAPDLEATKAYDDRPYPIGSGQTISQPYIVALMSELAQLTPPCKVLEVGTGSGYQAAVLAEMGCTVYTIEIIESLASRARETLAAEGYGGRVESRFGDGYGGWPEHAPFDAVLVTAAAPRIPQPLLDQLRIGGRLVIPVGEHWQVLEVHGRTKDGFARERVSDVRFVPMTGEIRRGLD
jgi:protein-L-isoaspartate(D-aspartate) O-methyltransferase